MSEAMIPWQGALYPFSLEDEKVIQSLIAGGYLEIDDHLSMLGVVTAARASERDRIVKAMEDLPIKNSVYTPAVVDWLRNGAVLRDS
jgi:hypothetical protein